jgi:hypothetical protein
MPSEGKSGTHDHIAQLSHKFCVLFSEVGFKRPIRNILKLKMKYFYRHGAFELHVTLAVTFVVEPVQGAFVS